MDMFLDASRLKLRFKSDMGLCSAEDLWDLTLTQLNNMYKGMVKEARSDGEDSLLSVAGTSVATKKLNLRIDIVKHVVETKLEEKDAKKKQAENRLEKQRLMAILATKKDEELQGQSVEDIEKRIAELN